MIKSITQKTCSVGGCSKKVTERGLCHMHYQRMWTNGTLGTLNEQHRLRAVPEYRIWAHLKGRCLNEKDKDYKNYGARGIRVCDRWLHSFKAFYEDMGPRPSSKHSIDRIDNDGNYEPGNCRWATSKEQNNNKRKMKLAESRASKPNVLPSHSLAGKPSTLLDCSPWR